MNSERVFRTLARRLRQQREILNRQQRVIHYLLFANELQRAQLDALRRSINNESNRRVNVDRVEETDTDSSWSAHEEWELDEDE